MTNPTAKGYQLADGWQLWRTFRLRATGFPAARVLDLAIPTTDVGAEELDQAIRATSLALRGHARDSRFQEAIAWQNRNALRTGIESLLRRTPETNDSRTRKLEQLVASYLQRYCTKNDTIGFFGPFGWGHIADHTELRGTSELARRTVYFEWWAINELATRLARDLNLHPWVAPRRLPLIRVEGNTLHAVNRPPSTISDAEVWVLRASDGTRSARDLQEAAAAAGLDVDVATVLRKLEHSQWLQWALVIPTEVIHPDHALRRELERIGDASLRDQALAILDELVRARDAVAAAAGDAERVSRASDALDEVFSRATGRRATRNEGEVYAARGIVYEDCVRGDELLLGPKVFEEFAAALSLVLDSARWYTYEIAKRYLEAFDAVYDALVRQTGSPTIELASFISRAPFASTQFSMTPIVAEVTSGLLSRWAEVLSASPSERRVHRSSAELASAVRERFSAPGPGWPLARYHSPDVLLAASDLAALQRGDLVAVLGEVHVAANTVLTPVFLKEYPQADELLSLRCAEVRPPCFAPMIAAKLAHRAAAWSLVEEDGHLALGSSVSWRRPDRVLAVADLVIERVDEQLFVRRREGEGRWHALEVLEDYLKAACLAHFGLVEKQPHTPRISIDKLVVARERWRFEPSDISFSESPTRAARLVEANRWAERHGIPRFIFVKVPEETKPFYVDLQSPVLVESFAKIVRKSSAVVVSEMLPSHGEHWLADDKGNRYSSELRFAAVDPIAFQTPEKRPR